MSITTSHTPIQQSIPYCSLPFKGTLGDIFMPSSTNNHDIFISLSLPAHLSLSAGITKHFTAKPKKQITMQFYYKFLYIYMYILDIFPLHYVFYSFCCDNVTPTPVAVALSGTPPCYLISWLLIEVNTSHVLLHISFNLEQHFSSDQKRVVGTTC